MTKETASFTGVAGVDPRLVPGTLITGRYRLEEMIGQGGCGVVFKATDTLLKSQLALKFLYPGFISDRRKFLRVKREINLSRKITDERTIKVFSLEKWESLYFLVMEFAAGKNLKDCLEEKGAYSWEEFKDIYFDILAGIAVLHKHNIIHRDLKPSNIIISGNNRVKILDFGLAKKITDKEKTSSIGEIVGSPFYMSPEQASGKEVDLRSDIYSSGMILYRALMGGHPFKEATTMEIIFKLIHSQPIKIEGTNRRVPRFVKFAIEKALGKKKGRRFQGIEEMLLFLKQGKTPLLGWLFSKLFANPLRIFLFGVLAVTLLLSLYFKAAVLSKVYYVEKKDSYLIARDGSGKELWQKDFFPYIVQSFFEPERPIDEKDRILHAYTDLVVLLQHPQNNSFSPGVSLNSLELDNRIVYLDSAGKKIFNRSFIEACGIETYDFAKITEIEEINWRDYDRDGKEEPTLMIRHSRGMYPTALCIIDRKALMAYSNPGSITNYNFLQFDENTVNFYVCGFNNMFAHLNFFSEITLNRVVRPKIIGIPNFNKTNDFSNSYKFLVFLPKGSQLLESYKEDWENEGVAAFTPEGIYWGKDYTLKIAGQLYKDTPRNLRDVYAAINQYYQEKILFENPGKAYSLILNALNYKIENPFLKSGLLFLKGDIEVLEGKYDKGEATLREALEFYPQHIDVAQRICEIEFLKGNPAKAIEKVDNEYSGAANFWGLGAGKSIFKSYCYLQMGNFKQAAAFFPKIVDRSDKLSIKCFQGILNIFKGNYRRAVADLKVSEDKFIYTLTVLELRLFTGRARVLAGIELERAKFHFEDILSFSKTKAHLAKISVNYFLAKEGRLAEAEEMAKPAFEELLRMAKGDFDTRLWLFYHAYIYGKTMALCGNRKEAERGYRRCIQANPHTELAARSAAALKSLRADM
ncbi:MAG: protein kinase [Candidatus Aminicenantes bacterium]|nr:protein kinase [Candidatus Aminicenantes bacterium]